MKKFMKILMILLSVIYPVIVFVFLYFLKTPVRVLSIFIIIVAAGIFLTFTSRNKDAKKTSVDIKQIITPILLLTDYQKYDPNKLQTSCTFYECKSQQAKCRQESKRFLTDDLESGYSAHIGKT